MSVYTGNVAGITPNLSNDNWTVHADAGEMGTIVEVGWGGEASSSTAMRTLIARATSIGSTPTAGNVQKKNAASAANLLAFVSAWTGQPTLAAGSLIPLTSWNSHGGVVRWIAGPRQGIDIIGLASAAASVSCRNSVGTATSSYGAEWEEA